MDIIGQLLITEGASEKATLPERLKALFAAKGLNKKTNNLKNIL